MKKILCLLLTLALLAGCQAQPATEPTQTTAATEPTVPNPVQSGTPWDTDGVLTQISLNIPNLWRYTSMADFNGDLLLWGSDTHRAGDEKILLCLVNPLTGEILAETQVQALCYQSPQIFGDCLYLCDSVGGQVLELDKNLQIRQRWEVEPEYGSWLMGGDATLYRFTDGESLTATNLNTHESRSLVPGGSDFRDIFTRGTLVSLEYADSETGSRVCACLNLTDGTLTLPPTDDEFNTVDRLGDTWLCSLWRDSSIFYLSGGDQLQRVESAEGNLRLLEEGYILETDYNGARAALYDLEGKFVSGCTLSDNADYYVRTGLVWNESLGGYFLMLECYDGSLELLFWDISKGTVGEDLALEPVPPESEQMQLLRQKAELLEQQYGVQILLGDRCETDFMDFTAELTEDYEAISAGLAELKTALSNYPEGFFRQLCFYDVRGVQIQLVGQLHPTEGSGREGGSYSAFTYPGADQFIVVVDIYSSSAQTYYHEFSHNIDLYLDYYAYAEMAGEALYSVDGWMALNPEGFDYSYDYTTEYEPFPEEDYENYFIDTYSTINPTEDRARVMEYAMSDYCGWFFEEYPGVMDKLAYYCACIREAFDTESWPETTLWEQYLG